jgi:hypothetical protein
MICYEEEDDCAPEFTQGNPNYSSDFILLNRGIPS